MLILVMAACSAYDITAANATIVIEAEPGTPGGIVFDETLPMRLETYGRTVVDGSLGRPYFGFLRAWVSAEVPCMEEDVVLELTTANEQLAVFFTRDVGHYAGMVSGGEFTRGGRSSRTAGSAEDVLQMKFPCMDETIPHRVSLSWAADGGAPIPYENPDDTSVAYGTSTPVDTGLAASP